MTDAFYLLQWNDKGSKKQKPKPNRMLSAIKKIWPYTKTVSNTGTSKQPQRSQTGTSSLILYRSIDTLPLDRFITCVCDQDLSVLVISGTPTPNELLSAWNDIYDEYVAAVNDKEQQHILRLTKEINCLEFDFKLIGLCVTRLEIEHSDEVLGILKKLIPTNLKFNPADLEQYKKDLSLVISKSKRMIIEIENKRGELGKLAPEKGSRVTRSEFDKVIVRASKFMAYKVDKKTTTVSEFVRIVDEMRKEADSIEQINKAKNGR